jgi:hypothetical protein
MSVWPSACGSTLSTGWTAQSPWAWHGNPKGRPCRGRHASTRWTVLSFMDPGRSVRIQLRRGCDRVRLGHEGCAEFPGNPASIVTMLFECGRGPAVEADSRGRSSGGSPLVLLHPMHSRGRRLGGECNRATSFSGTKNGQTAWRRPPPGGNVTGRHRFPGPRTGKRPGGDRHPGGM